MKHIFSAILIAIATISLSSCGTTRITYGDISVLDNNGQTIRHWDNCSMEENESKYNPTTNTVQNIRYYHGINRQEGLSFMDSTGETHYVSGGIIIVDNIHSEYEANQKQYEVTYNQKTAKELTEELEKVNQEITETLKYIRNNKHKRTSLGEYQDQQAKLKQLRQRRTQIENLLRERWRLE